MNRDPRPRKRLGLRDLVAAGPRAMWRYTGTLLGVFVVQSIVAAACMLAVALVLAQTFAKLPLFDDAVDGDPVALVYCLRYGHVSFAAIGGIVLAIVLFWQLCSWFLVGGIFGVLSQQPDGRRATARSFGAAGASTYLTYARLALCALPGWVLSLFVLGVGLTVARAHNEYPLTLTELFVPILLGALPAILLLHLFWTVEDYARAELTLRGDSHDPGVIATYLRSFAYVLRRPVTLVHGALGWLAFLLVTLAYAYLAAGHPMYGSSGAVTLFVARSGVALVRLAIRFGVLGGQIELARTRPPPPRKSGDD
ncbi:MAG TPA: hypothetical protein VGM88_01885 [Kofleriaceae bacterium]